MKKIRKPLFLLLCAVILLSACLCGCGQKAEKGFPIAVSDAGCSVFEVCRDNYTDKELTEILQYMTENRTVKALNDKYPIECLRKDADGYRVIYNSAKNLLVLKFDTEANWLERSEQESIYTIMTTVAFYDPLKVGDDVEAVKAVDKYAYFAFEDDPSKPLCSDHYCGDGYRVHIDYDADHSITAITTDIG